MIEFKCSCGKFYTIQEECMDPQEFEYYDPVSNTMLVKVWKNSDVGPYQVWDLVDKDDYIKNTDERLRRQNESFIII